MDWAAATPGCGARLHLSEGGTQRGIFRKLMGTLHVAGIDRHEYDSPMGGYHLDLSTVSLDAFFDTLREGLIAPGRTVLLEDKENPLEAIKSAGVGNLADLEDRLKTKPRLSAFAEETGLDADYLTILRRQAQSYLPKPVPLRNFPEVSEAVVARLAEEGIAHGKHLYDAVPDPADAAEAAARFGVDEEGLRKLRALVDLSRITGVGPVFARFFYSIGIRSLSDLARGDAEDLYERLGRVSEDYSGPKATRWDVEQCIRSAAALEEADG